MKPAKATDPDAEWIAGLKVDPAYVGLDVDREIAKARRWCAENRKQLSRRRVVAWLNRCDVPIAAPSGFDAAAAERRNAF